MRPTRRIAPSTLAVASFGYALISGADAEVDQTRAAERSVHSRTSEVPIATLATLARWGDLLLVEPDRPDAPGQAALFGFVPAPPERVFEVVADVRRYPDFIETMTHIRVLDRRDGLLAYRWVATVPPLVRMDGVRLQRSRPPHLVEVRGHSGALRGTRERFEVHPVPGGTLLAMYRSLDIETGHVLLRTVAGVDPSMEQGINLSTLLIHFRGLRELLVGVSAGDDAPEAPGVTPLPIEAHLDALAPMLEHGTVLVVQSTRGGPVAQVLLAEAVDAPAAIVRRVIREADRWPEFIDSLESQTMTQVTDASWDLEWRISIPMGSVGGTSRMKLRPDGAIVVDTLSGDIQSGRAHWVALGRGEGRSILVHHSYSDLREASWLLGILLDAEPYLEHGILGAAGTLAVTRMKARAEELSP